MENISEMLVEQISPYDFAKTRQLLEEAIANAGLQLFARIDHAEGAAKFGLEMPPTLVLIYGHPKGGTPIMLAYPDAALDLPLRLLLRERADGQTSVVFRPIATTLAADGVPEDIAARLVPAQQLITKFLAATR